MFILGLYSFRVLESWGFGTLGFGVLGLWVLGFTYLRAVRENAGATCDDRVSRSVSGL